MTKLKETKKNTARRGLAKKSYGRFDHDGLWKDLIERFFHCLLKRALPELYKDADLSKKPKFLDKEFRDVLNTADPKIHTSPHFADYVVEIALKNGEAELVLLHIEVQGKGGGDLATRMHQYQCLIFAHYGKEPVALAIITDGRPEGEARSYTHFHYGTRSVYEYNRLVLKDLSEAELLASGNPIDLVFYAAKCALSGPEELQKYMYLRTLAGLLAERGWSREDKRDLMLFIERFIYLRDEKLQKQYWKYRQELNKEGKIVYVSFLKDVEKKMTKEEGKKEGRKEGEMEGRKEAKEEVARNLLNCGVSADIIAKSTGLSQDIIRTLLGKP